MKNITNKSINEDLTVINNLFIKYRNAVWEGQKGQSAHYDKQDKRVQIEMCDIVTALNVARQALSTLNIIKVKED